MPSDYYLEAGHIIDALVSEGMEWEATKLRDVIMAGSTSTEILMGMRWHLQEIDRANASKNAETKRRIKDLLGKLKVPV
jgi:hypothetical protein